MPITINQVDNSKLPDGFPKDIPLEKNAEILQNYNADLEGRVQATRSFLSKENIQKNFQFYYNYLNSQKNGWFGLIVNEVMGGNTRVLFAKRGIENIQIIIDSQDKGIGVDISVTTLKIPSQK
jgi:hypothetical protein